MAQKIIPKVEISISIIESFSAMRLRNLVFYINNVIQNEDATDIQGMGINSCCQYLTVEEYLYCLCPTASLFLLSMNAFWEIHVCLLQAETTNVNYLPLIYYLLAVYLFENLVSQWHILYFLH